MKKIMILVIASFALVNYGSSQSKDVRKNEPDPKKIGESKWNKNKS